MDRPLGKSLVILIATVAFGLINATGVAYAQDPPDLIIPVVEPDDSVAAIAEIEAETQSDAHDEASHTCQGVSTTHVGTDSADTINGTTGIDSILAKAGADTIRGFEGTDFVCAGRGADEVFGDDGIDYLKGGGHNDTLRGRANQDVIWGGSGQDQLLGNANGDTIYGGSGDDLIWGGPGSNDLRGGPGSDVYYICTGDGAGDKIEDDGTDIILRSSNYCF